MCEKPDAIDVTEALKMKNAADEAGKVLMVIRNNRFAAASQYAKKFVEDGKMSKIYCGRCGWQRRRGIPGKGGWFTTKEQSGGGPLIDLGVHMIDLAVWLMGNPTPVAASANTYSKLADNGVEFYTEEDGQLLDIIPKGNMDSNGHKKNIQNFIDVITEGAEPVFKPSQGVDMIKILCAIYESAEKGREIHL